MYVSQSVYVCVNAPGCCQLSLVGITAPYVCLWGCADVCHRWRPDRPRTQYNDSFMPACHECSAPANGHILLGSASSKHVELDTADL